MPASTSRTGVRTRGRAREYHALILGSRYDADGALRRRPADALAPRLQLLRAHGPIHPGGHETVGNDRELRGRRALPPERRRDRPAHGDDPRGRPAGEPVLQVERPRHLPAGQHQRHRQTAQERQPGERLPVARALGIDQVDRVAREQRRERGGVGPARAGAERQRQHLEAARAGERLDLGVRRTDEPDRRPAAREAQREMERRRDGAGAPALMQHLDHRRGIREEGALATPCSGPAPADRRPQQRREAVHVGVLGERPLPRAGGHLVGPGSVVQRLGGQRAELARVPGHQNLGALAEVPVDVRDAPRRPGARRWPPARTVAGSRRARPRPPRLREHATFIATDAPA